MNSRTLKAEVVKWAKKIGRKEATRRLINTGLSPSMAERLVKGTYECEPHVDRADAIRTEISKDGFSSPNEKAS